MNTDHTLLSPTPQPRSLFLLGNTPLCLLRHPLGYHRPRRCPVGMTSRRQLADARAVVLSQQTTGLHPSAAAAATATAVFRARATAAGLTRATPHPPRCPRLVRDDGRRWQRLPRLTSVPGRSVYRLLLTPVDPVLVTASAATIVVMVGPMAVVVTPHRRWRSLKGGPRRARPACSLRCCCHAPVATTAAAAPSALVPFSVADP